MIERYRAATDRLTQRDDLAERELGWRMALCEAELARAAGADDAANWEAVRPALSKRPAPFLESYVLWRTAEAVAGAGGSAGMAAAPSPSATPMRSQRGSAPACWSRRSRAWHGGCGWTSCGRSGSHAVDRATPRRTSPLPDEPADPFGLTTREREVLALVAEGYTNRRIADSLFISESTAGVHVSHILGKLGVETRTEAAAVAVRLGLDRDVVG